MPADKTKENDYQTIKSPAKTRGANGSDQSTLKSPEKQPPAKEKLFSKNLVNVKKIPEETVISPDTEEIAPKESSAVSPNSEQFQEEISYSEKIKLKKQEKKDEKDRRLLSADFWIKRNGHHLSYIGLYLFSILVLFRPYELTPSLSFLSATAFYFAIATLIIYIPTQFVNEGNLTVLSTEVKAILAMAFIALITIPIAKSPAMAWETFNDPYIKSVLMFIVMVNVLRTRRKLMGLVWLSLSIGVVLSYMALGMYMRGEFTVEGYRVGLEIGGMFENPNEMSIHLVMMIPLAVTLAIATKFKLMRVIYLAMAVIMLCANMITYSRGGFLALIASSAFLVWKLGRKNRVGVSLTAIVIGVLVTLFAPGNFGLRVLSIFIPGLDEAGSSSQRRELLERSILVTIRNPWGIGIGNFPIVGVRNLVSHNAYTQVSSEIGLLGLAAYLVFIFSPFRKLGAIERTQFAKDDLNWFYYLAIGLQTSFVAYFVASFFASIAYNWFVYYLIAYAVAFRRIYQIENNLIEEVKPEPLWEWKTA